LTTAGARDARRLVMVFDPIGIIPKRGLDVIAGFDPWGDVFFAIASRCWR